MKQNSPLFSPLELGKLTLPNRFAMAPLTRNRAADGNVPHELNATYYSQRASAGLIVTEASQVSEQGVGYPRTPGIHTRSQVEGWKKVTSAVHREGGRIFLQLWHVGRISHPSLQPEKALPVAPSAIKPAGNAFTYDGPEPFVTPRALESSELPGIVEQFRKAAENAREAGFDGVEIHGANGYLLDQFIRSGTNHREDEYGGTPENRARLMLQVVKAVIGVWGEGRVALRISPMGTFNDMSDADPKATFGYLASALNEFPLAYLHIVEAGEEDLKGKPNPVPLSFFREHYKGRIMANGGYDLERATGALSEGLCDLVSFGKLFLANPDLVKRFQLAAPLNPADFTTFYGGDEKGYTDYPFFEGAGAA
jgi:N-ethylmaleimide reductase